MANVTNEYMTRTVKGTRVNYRAFVRNADGIHEVVREFVTSKAFDVNNLTSAQQATIWIETNANARAFCRAASLNLLATFPDFENLSRIDAQYRMQLDVFFANADYITDDENYDGITRTVGGASINVDVATDLFNKSSVTVYLKSMPNLQGMSGNEQAALYSEIIAKARKAAKAAGIKPMNNSAFSPNFATLVETKSERWGMPRARFYELAEIVTPES